MLLLVLLVSIELYAQRCHFNRLVQESRFDIQQGAQANVEGRAVEQIL